MNKKLQFALSLIAITVLAACHQKRIDPYGTGKSDYNLGNSNDDFKGARTKDESLQAITIPCQDNNTFRLYYSDSAKNLGLPDSLTIVAYSKKIHLGYKECCIEVTSSVGDTWLSTGSGNIKIAAGTGDIASGKFDEIWLQHFTSTPQSDSTTVTFNLVNE